MALRFYVVRICGWFMYRTAFYHSWCFNSALTNKKRNEHNIQNDTRTPRTKLIPMLFNDLYIDQTHRQIQSHTHSHTPEIEQYRESKPKYAVAV